MCIMIYKPVCGNLANGNKKTFGNSCVACANKDVIDYTEGPCGNTNIPLEIENPVPINPRIQAFI